MPLSRQEYEDLQRRLTAAVATGDPEGPVRNISDDLISRGDLSDVNIGRLVQLKLGPTRNATSVQDSVEDIRSHLAWVLRGRTPLGTAPAPVVAPTVAIPPPPTNLMAAFNSAAGSLPRAGAGASTGGRRRKTRRGHRKASRKTRRRRHH